MQTHTLLHGTALTAVEGVNTTHEQSHLRFMIRSRSTIRNTRSIRRLVRSILLLDLVPLGCNLLAARWLLALRTVKANIVPATRAFLVVLLQLAEFSTQAIFTKAASARRPSALGAGSLLLACVTALVADFCRGLTLARVAEPSVHIGGRSTRQGCYGVGVG